MLMKGLFEFSEERLQGVQIEVDQEGRGHVGFMGLTGLF